MKSLLNLRRLSRKPYHHPQSHSDNPLDVVGICGRLVGNENKLKEKFMKFTKEQALAIMGFTGITTTNFSTFHEDVEKRMGDPVWTHQFLDEEFSDKVNALYKDDFLSFCCEDYK